MIKKLLDIWAIRGIVFELSKREFQRQYTGSYLGFVWIFLQPLLFIGVLYLVFSFGLRDGVKLAYPFSIYLVCGLVAWTFIADNLSATTRIVDAYGYLVKRVDFHLEVLPIVQINSSLVAHMFLVTVAVVVASIEGFHPTLYTLQVFYYLLGAIFLLLGVGWMTSSTNVFVQDVAKLVSVFVRFGFWLTPIFWSIDMVPADYQVYLKVNPAYYIVSGYRDSIVGGVGFWEHPGLTAYFWILSITIFIAGFAVFGRLKPHFAEVL